MEVASCLGIQLNLDHTEGMDNHLGGRRKVKHNGAKILQRSGADFKSKFKLETNHKEESDFGDSFVFNKFNKEEPKAREPSEIKQAVDRFKCHFCEKTFKVKGDARKHRHRLHPGMANRGDVACNICSRFFTVNALSRHVKFKHAGENVSFLDEVREARRDFDLKTQGTLSCQFCGAKFAMKKYLRKHKIKFHAELPGEGDIACKFCPKFYSQNSMGVHVLSKHPNKGKVTKN